MGKERKFQMEANEVKVGILEGVVSSSGGILRMKRTRNDMGSKDKRRNKG